MSYERNGEKNHGKSQQNRDKLKAIAIEDLISNGKSSIEVCDALKEAGHDVLEVSAIFSYKLARSERSFKENNIKIHSLSPTLC